MSIIDADLVRVGRLSGLWGEDCGSVLEVVEGGDQFCRAFVSVVIECGGDVGMVKRQFEATQDGAGVHALVDSEHAHPAVLSALDQGSLDGCGSAMGGQEGEVEVEPAEFGGG